MKNILRIIIAAVIMLAYSSEAFSQRRTVKGDDFLVTINTSYGSIKILLYDDTPIHKENFLRLAREGFYNFTTFHRLVNNFMIQGGEDTTDFKNGKTYEELTLPAEFLPHRTHIYGAVSMARNENPEKRSDRTQFFIVQNCNGAHFLDGQYTVFGQVVSGMEVVKEIAKQETNLAERPLYPIRMRITIEKVDRSEIIKFYSYTYE